MMGPAGRLSRDFVRLVTHRGLDTMPVGVKAGSLAKLVERALIHRFGRVIISTLSVMLCSPVVFFYYLFLSLDPG